MRIPSNKISDVVRFFREELKSLYEKEEIETFIAFCFEEYLFLKRADISLNGNIPVNESELLKFSFAIKDLKQQKPIQYILGKADFYRLKFIVNPYVLIPRPETEELVALIIKENQEGKTRNQEPRIKKGNVTHFSTQLSILDIGTGSGCISIALKKKLPESSIFALDISEEALMVAKQNATLNNVHIDLYKYDILSLDFPLPYPETKFDIIVSNPPYISISERPKMAPNVFENEPAIALFVDDNNPLLFYKTIADFALKHLKLNGKLYFEINQAFGLETKKLLENKGFKNVILTKDLNNNYRILQGNI